MQRNNTRIPPASHVSSVYLNNSDHRYDNNSNNNNNDNNYKNYNDNNNNALFIFIYLPFNY